jgi:hypothetical protein
MATGMAVSGSPTSRESELQAAAQEEYSNSAISYGGRPATLFKSSNAEYEPREAASADSRFQADASLALRAGWGFHFFFFTLLQPQSLAGTGLVAMLSGVGRSRLNFALIEKAATRNVAATSSVDTISTP